jgi:hypothetical protein
MTPGPSASMFLSLVFMYLIEFIVGGSAHHSVSPYLHSIIQTEKKNKKIRLYFSAGKTVCKVMHNACM